MKTLFVVMGLIAFAVVFLLGLSVGVGSQGGISFSGESISSWITALATVAIAVLTVILANESWKLRKIQNEQIDKIRKDSIKPAITAQFKNAPVEFSFLNLHIKNNGVGSAHRIRFRFKNLDERNYEAFTLIEEQLNKLLFLNRGISSLGPGEERTTFALNLIELNNKNPGQFFKYSARLEISYEDIEGAQFRSAADFNFNEYEGVSQVGVDPLHKMASKIESLAKDFSSLVAGQKKIRTDIYDSDDRKKEADKRWEQIAQHQARQRKPDEA